MAGREYAIVKSSFWTGETGRKLRKAGGDAQRIAFYLITCSSSNMIGLYYLPIPLLCHELGISTEGASKGLRRVIDSGFADYEAPSEVVFVFEMASHQLGEPIAEKDNRHKSIVRLWQEMRKSKFYMEFHARYKGSFNLPDPSPFEAPSKPLRSQDQEQEQDKEQDQDQEPPKSPKGDLLPVDLATDDFRLAWEDFIKHRSEIGHKLKPTASRNALAKLAGMGAVRAVAALRHSIANGWQGIFEPDEKRNGHTKTLPVGDGQVHPHEPNEF